MKKVTFLTQYYLPEMGAPPARISETAFGLVAKGHVVKIVTSVPNRPEGQVHEGFRENFFYKSIENKIVVVRVSIFLPKIFGDFINRLLSETSFVVSALIFGLSELRGSDVIIIQNPPLFSGLASPILKILTNAKVINWCSDIWPDLHQELGTLQERGVVTNVMRLIQKISLRFSDAVAVTTSRTIDQVRNVYGVDKTFLWPNAVDTSFFYPHDAKPSHRDNWGVDQTSFLVGYAGLHGNFQNLHVVLDAAKLTTDSKVRFVLVGSGPQKPELRKRVINEKIDNVIFVESMPKSCMPNALQAFDVLLVPLATPMPTTIPSKFYEYISSGKPVVVVSGSEISDMVVKHGLGAVYECGAAKSLAREVIKLHQLGAVELATIKDNARRLAVNFDRTKVVDKINADLELL
jgi:colanic acid biosynthesis glycosyl transferase WcaI